MLIRYCCGNIDILKLASFAEICEIIEYLVNKEKDETLLRAYQVSYAALQNINFDEFKKKALQKLTSLPPTVQPTVKQIESKVEDIIDNYQWEEV